MHAVLYAPMSQQAVTPSSPVRLRRRMMLAVNDDASYHYCALQGGPRYSRRSFLMSRARAR
jgi:hypothetical protein